MILLSKKDADLAHDGTNVVSVSKTICDATSGGKVGNIKSLRLNKKKASIKAGKTVRLKASTTAESKNGEIVTSFRKFFCNTIVEAYFNPPSNSAGGSLDFGNGRGDVPLDQD